MPTEGNRSSIMTSNKLALLSSAVLVVLAALVLPVIPTFFTRDLSVKNGTITVANNTVLSFTDSGPPKTSPYTTVFLVHGMSFNAGKSPLSLLTLALS